LAVQDFKTVCKMLPSDKEARQKYETTLKEYKLREFAKCLGYDNTKVEVNVEDMIVEDNYAGPRLDNGIEELNAEWVVKLLDYMKEGKVLHKKYAAMIILRARDIFEKEHSLQHISVPDDQDITVCGDVHGQFYDLLNIFSLNGNPSEVNPYVFNGDFIDRGSFGIEVIMALLAWKVCYPKHFYMTRGNHEAKSLNKLYGFEGEVRHKYDVKTYDLFASLFCYLPLAHCINKKILIVHGGLFSKDGVKLEDIQKVDRVREPPEEGIMCEVLWSDPCDEDGRQPSKRGVGI
jgi:serine/threonine-protein phosphatase 5